MNSNKKNQDNLRISVITPNYNYGHFVGKTIESVINQDYENLEHIVVDDGSTDNSVDIIKKYADRFPEQVKLICQNNKGQAAAVNTGLKNITGDIIGWINSDDWYCDGIFKSIMKIFADRPKIDIVYGNYFNVDPKGEIRFLYKDIKFTYLMACIVGFGQMMASNTIFWRKTLFDKTGYFDESYDYALDNEYFSRLTKGANIKKINIPVANFRYHPQSKTGVHHREKIEHYKEERRKVSIRAYNSLKISKFISFKHIWILNILLRSYRIGLRFISGHYFPKVSYYIKSKKTNAESK